MATFESKVQCMTLSKDSTTLFSCIGGDIEQWNVSNGECLKTLKIDHLVVCMALSHDATILFAGGSEGYQSITQ